MSSSSTPPPRSASVPSLRGGPGSLRARGLSAAVNVSQAAGGIPRQLPTVAPTLATAKAPLVPPRRSPRLAELPQVPGGSLSGPGARPVFPGLASAHTQQFSPGAVGGTTAAAPSHVGQASPPGPRHSPLRGGPRRHDISSSPYLERTVASGVAAPVTFTVVLRTGSPLLR